MSNIIFCPSLPQSATWFALRLIEKCGYKIEHIGEILRRTENRVVETDKPTILHCHIFPFYYQGNAYKEALPSFGGDPIQDYVVRRYHISLNAIELLASMHKTIIPIREPLNCLLTRESRAPNLRHFYITDGFIEVAKRFSDHPNVKFLPVDLYSSNEPTEELIEERKYILRDVLSHCGINVYDNGETIEKTAMEWKRENTITTNRFRKPYENRNIDRIKEMLGSKWAEVEHLKIHAATILPFLNKIGYNTAVNPLLW